MKFLELKKTIFIFIKKGRAKPSWVKKIMTSLGAEYQLKISNISSENELKFFDNENPQLIIIDSNIFINNEKQILEHLNNKTSIICFSDKPKTDKLVSDYLLYGADDFIKSDFTDKEILARIKSKLRSRLIIDNLKKSNISLHRLSNTDDLTGLYNMRAFNGHYAKAINDCKKSQTPISVFMLDLDNFKQVNDTTNHLIGSYVLKAIGKILKNSNILSSNDLISRYGGDEYIILTRDGSFEISSKKAENLRKLIKNSVFIKDGITIRITTSIGLSWTPPGYEGGAEDPIKAADMMLYESKEGGRDKVFGLILKYPIEFDKITDLQFIDLEKTDNDDEVELLDIYRI